MNFKLNKDSLNFNVYVETAFPETAEENDIVIISEVPMKNWILSPDAQSGAPSNDGDVWLTYSVDGNTFNALKQNSMMIAMISAKQYVGGTWVDKTAKSYRNGEWVDWITWLYNNGDECFDVSGGFATYNYVVDGSGSSARAPTLTKGEKSMTIAETSTSSYAGAVFNETPFNVDGFSKLVVVYSGKEGGNSPTLDLTKTKATGFVRDASANNLGTDGIAVIDISQLSGEYYFAVTTAGNYKKSITIHEIKLM